MLLEREVYSQYFNMRKFNLENKDITIINFYHEMKYSVGLLMTFKEMGEFVKSVLKAKTKFELDKEVRLRLHQ
jgi:hypothetical protein